MAGKLEDRMGIDTEVNVRRGGAVNEILEEEVRVGATSTLMGARGTSRLRRLLLGSTSESVVAQGNNNVILVSPDAEALG
jgi:nucleotide-binding universal stress UspA family protein